MTTHAHVQREGNNRTYYKSINDKNTESLVKENNGTFL